MTLPSQSAGHTAGPWNLVSDPYEDGKPYFEFTAGRGNYPDGFHIAGILSEADAKLIARAPDLLAENSKLKGQLEEAVELLTKAVESVRAWHGMGMLEADEKAMWDIYWNNSPEMKPIRLFLSKLKEAGS